MDVLVVVIGVFGPWLGALLFFKTIELLWSYRSKPVSTSPSTSEPAAQAVRKPVEPYVLPPIDEWQDDPWGWERRIVKAVVEHRVARRRAGGDIRPRCKVCGSDGYRRLYPRPWWPYWIEDEDGRRARLPHGKFCPRCISPVLADELDR